MTVGYVILTLAVSVVLMTPLILWRLYAQAKPKQWDHGFGVQFLPEAVQPWAKLWLTLSHLRAYVLANWPERALRDVWIVVHKHDDVLSPPGVLPAGVSAKNVTGYYETVEYFLGLKRVSVIHVRQLTAHVSYTSDGAVPRVLPAEQSALLHEFCEHHLPRVVTGDRNTYHNPRWLQETQAVRRLIDTDTSGNT